MKRFGRPLAAMLLALPLIGGAVSEAQAVPVKKAEQGQVQMAFTASNACPAGVAGYRQQNVPVTFPAPFSNTNYVALVSISGFDIDRGRNARIGARVLSKTAAGMVIQVWTWCDTIVYSATVQYLAVGI